MLTINLLISGPNTRVPAPNPNTARPVIVPRMSGNYLMQGAIGGTYANPTPKPQRTPKQTPTPPIVLYSAPDKRAPEPRSSRPKIASFLGPALAVWASGS